MSLLDVGSDILDHLEGGFPVDILVVHQVCGDDGGAATCSTTLYVIAGGKNMDRLMPA